MVSRGVPRKGRMWRVMSPIRALVALLASLALVLSGPALGAVRSAIRDAFAAGTYRLILNAGVAIAALLLVGAALARLRTRRTLRLTLIAAAVVVAAGSAIVTASASASQNAVERFHFIEYTVVILLWYRAVKPAASAPDGAADLSLLIVPAFAAVVVSAADEWMQWFVPERVGEWKDILLNVTAIAAGLLFSLGVDPPARITASWQPGSRRRTGRALALAIVSVAAFLQTVHMGTIVRDVAVGAFRSRYTAPELVALSRDRSERWASAPPPAAFVRYSREDQYLAEAVWHVRARNEAWATDIRRAWFENRLLEKYFAPALDVASYAMAASRWPPDQRADARARVGDALPGDFVSRAEPLTIFTWRPAIFWMVVAILAMISLGIGERRAH